MNRARISIRRLGPLGILAAAAACGSGAHGQGGPSGGAGGGTADVPSAGPPPGYVRYATSAVTVAPGTSGQWLEWVASPFDHDVDVVDIQGTQSPGGHHAVLYAVSDVQPVGTVHVWQDQDIASAHFLGGIGGEGGAQLKLPAGAVFRLHKGQALALQVHYLNAGAEPLQGTSQLDVKFADPSPSDRVASMVTNTALSFQVPAEGKLHVEVSCTVGQDLSVLMFTNHLHQWGTSATTQLTDATGAKTMLQNDPVWNSEWTTNPNFTRFTADAPMLIKAGETLTTACDWDNTTAQPLAFPMEMCVFIGFFLGDQDMGCVDNGSWMAE